jgi:hypothetical protein
MLAVHADWSINPAKRWMCIADRTSTGWLLGCPEPVGPPETLFARLRRRAGGGAIAFGIDCPLGIPRAYAALRPEPDFPAFLRGLGDTPGFFQVAATLAEASATAPFYPARGLSGMTRLAHAQAIGLATAADLSRACDRATAERPAGAPVFWTLGANQSGKAAISAWRHLLLPALHGQAPPRLWPFEGPFRSLIQPGRIAVAETYPAEAMRHLGLKPAGSKRRQADRAAYAPGIILAMQRLAADAKPALRDALAAGMGDTPAGEDQFDCVLGVLAVIGVLTGGRTDEAPGDPAIQRWEGWVLGQTALPRQQQPVRPAGQP